MSFYRFARMTAIVALLRRYRGRLSNLVFATAFALVTSWLYPDIAHFVEARHPDWLGPILAFKTLIIYAALLVILWQLRCMISGDEPLAAPSTHEGQAQRTTRKNATKQQAASVSNSELDKLIDKPKLRSRKDNLLNKQDS